MEIFYSRKLIRSFLERFPEKQRELISIYTLEYGICSLLTNKSLNEICLANISESLEQAKLLLTNKKKDIGEVSNTKSKNKMRLKRNNLEELDHNNNSISVSISKIGYVSASNNTNSKRKLSNNNSLNNNMNIISNNINISTEGALTTTGSNANLSHFNNKNITLTNPNNSVRNVETNNSNRNHLSFKDGFKLNSSKYAKLNSELINNSKIYKTNNSNVINKTALSERINTTQNNNNNTNVGESYEKRLLKNYLNNYLININTNKNNDSNKNNHTNNIKDSRTKTNKSKPISPNNLLISKSLSRKSIYDSNNNTYYNNSNINHINNNDNIQNNKSTIVSNFTKTHSINYNNLTCFTNYNSYEYETKEHFVAILDKKERPKESSQKRRLQVEYELRRQEKLRKLNKTSFGYSPVSKRVVKYVTVNKKIKKNMSSDVEYDREFKINSNDYNSCNDNITGGKIVSERGNVKFADNNIYNYESNTVNKDIDIGVDDNENTKKSCNDINTYEDNNNINDDVSNKDKEIKEASINRYKNLTNTNENSNNTISKINNLNNNSNFSNTNKEERKSNCSRISNYINNNSKNNNVQNNSNSNDEIDFLISSENNELIEDNIKEDNNNEVKENDDYNYNFNSTDKLEHTSVKEKNSTIKEESKNNGEDNNNTTEDNFTEIRLVNDNETNYHNNKIELDSRYKVKATHILSNNNKTKNNINNINIKDIKNMSDSNMNISNYNSNSNRHTNTTITNRNNEDCLMSSTQGLKINEFNNKKNDKENKNSNKYDSSLTFNTKANNDYKVNENSEVISNNNTKNSLIGEKRDNLNNNINQSNTINDSNPCNKNTTIKKETNKDSIHDYKYNDYNKNTSNSKYIEIASNHQLEIINNQDHKNAHNINNSDNNNNTKPILNFIQDDLNNYHYIASKSYTELTIPKLWKFGDQYNKETNINSKKGTINFTYYFNNIINTSNNRNNEPDLNSLIKDESLKRIFNYEYKTTSRLLEIERFKEESLKTLEEINYNRNNNTNRLNKTDCNQTINDNSILKNSYYNENRFNNSAFICNSINNQNRYNNNTDDDEFYSRVNDFYYNVLETNSKSKSKVKANNTNDKKYENNAGKYMTNNYKNELNEDSLFNNNKNDKNDNHIYNNVIDNEIKRKLFYSKENNVNNNISNSNSSYLNYNPYNKNQNKYTASTQNNYNNYSNRPNTIHKPIALKNTKINNNNNNYTDIYTFNPDNSIEELIHNKIYNKSNDIKSNSNTLSARFNHSNNNNKNSNVNLNDNESISYNNTNNTNNTLRILDNKINDNNDHENNDDSQEINNQEDSENYNSYNVEVIYKKKE